MRHRLRRRIVGLSLVAVALAAGRAAAQRPEIPAEYQDLFAQLAERLDAFDSTLTADWNRSRSAVILSAEFFPAHSSRLSGLLSTFYPSFPPALQRFREIGARAVTLTINYPLLLPDFHQNWDEQRAYTRFYKRVVADARALGLTVIVKTHAMPPSAAPELAAYYARLRSYDEYKRGRLEVARTIARELRPDFLSVQTEPDTEAYLTGLPLDSPDAAVDLINFLYTGLRLAGSTARIGAGLGTWHIDYDAHLEALLTRTPVEYIDLHVYPVNRNYLDRLLDGADRAARAGKAIGVSDAWLYKLRDEEVPYAPMLSGTLLGRDAYSFWAPLDERFLAVLMKAAHAKRFAFVSPFWSGYLFSYADYETTRHLSDAERLGWTMLSAMLALRGGALTTTGVAFSRLAAW